MFIKCFVKILICLSHRVEFCEEWHCPFHHFVAKAQLGAEHMVGPQ